MLPYKTIDEASAVLGRPLTALETLWFNYSASKSDYFLHCHNILVLFLVFTCVSVLYAFLDLVSSYYYEIRKYKIQPKVKLSLSQTFRCYRDVVRVYFLVACPLLLLSYPYSQMIGIRTSLPLPSLGEVVAQLLVYFIIEDYTNYWYHRFLHCNKWVYEKIHRVHHEYTAPIGFASVYAHWAEVPLGGIFQLLGPAVAPGHMITFWLWFALRQIEAIDTHSGYDFPWSPTKYIPFYGGAEFHDYHHYVGGQSHSNFASLFIYCDYIYGTDKGYQYQKKLRKELKDGVKSTGLQNGSSDNSNMYDYKSD